MFALCIHRRTRNCTMPVSPAACERITSNLSRLVRTGRHLAARAAEQLYGELPSFGWTLLVPLERDGEQRCSALAAHAGVDVSVVSRQVARLEKAGYVERRPDPRDGGASLIGLTPAGAAAASAGAPPQAPPPSPPPGPSGPTGPPRPSPPGRSRTPSSSARCS